MRLCRFNSTRLGLVEGDTVFDVSAALEAIPAYQWGTFAGDPLVIHLPAVMRSASELRRSAEHFPLSSVTLHSPITHPGKVMAAPANYRLHVELDTNDPGVDQGVHRKALEGVERPAEKYGLFLKATSALVGPHEGVSLVLPDRRTDHEVELSVVIGKTGHGIPATRAMEHVAGYCIGLDMTVRGAEDRSFRKSPDGYSVLGPWLVTADEIPDPMALQLSLYVNGEQRQYSSTGAMTVNIPDLIALASSVYTLQPGDVIMTGTPEGVSEVHPGDVITCCCTGIGEMRVSVRLHPTYASQ